MDDNATGAEAPERSFGEVQEREDVSDVETDEQVETTDDDGDESGSEQTDDQESEETEEDQDQEESQEPKKTEKGTKVDPNPKSAVHQALANERKVRGQMERVLADPKLMAQFMKQQYGIDVQIPNGQAAKPAQEQTPAAPTKKWTAKDFENLEDVADKFNQLHEGFNKEIAARDQKIEELTKQVTGITSNGRLREIADNTASDVKALQSEPELNPKHVDFIPGLEEQISDMYYRLDYDEASGQFKGQYSMKDIGAALIKTAREARKAGVKRGQTIVKDKTGGKVRTSNNGKQAVDTSQLSPGASIAQGIAKMFPRG